MNIPTEFTIWFAGFFDGDGNIRATGKKRRTFVLSVTQSQDNKGEMITKKLEETFGGHARTYRDTHKDGFKRRALWTWDLAKRSEVLKTLILIEPYLWVKKEKVQEYIKKIQKIELIKTV